jgi:hypothetical protein
MDARATGLVVSADGSRIATSSSQDAQFPTYPQISKVLVTDVASGKVLWSQAIQSWVTPRVEAFADAVTLVETVQDVTGGEGASDRLPINPEIHLIGGLGTGHVTDTATGVFGYGPVTRLGSQWWYARDSWAKVTSLYTNPDLTPAHETKVADRVDGTTTYGYLPLTQKPA